MRVQTQSFTLATSHFPSTAPPQGPVRSPLGHWALGQRPPNSPMVQFPHITHWSERSLPPLEPPRERVSFEPYTGTSATLATEETPLPQPMTRIQNASFIFSFFSTRDSKDLMLQAAVGSVQPTTCFPLSSSLLHISRTSGSPPVLSFAAQTLHPITKILSSSFNMARISSKGFAEVIIIITSNIDIPDRSGLQYIRGSFRR